MADKMMRLAGRGTDGTAKAIKTNDLGALQVAIEAGEREQLITEVSVLANNSVSYEVGLSQIISAAKAIVLYSEIELSWFSVDGIGAEGTEVEIYYHRLAGNLGFQSVSFVKKLKLNEGIAKLDGGTYCIDSDLVRRVKNNFITVKFINNTLVNKGLYYPTLILKK